MIPQLEGISRKRTILITSTDPFFRFSSSPPDHVIQRTDKAAASGNHIVTIPLLISIARMQL